MTPTIRSRDTLPILPLKWPIYIAFIRYSAMDEGRSIKFSSKYA